MKNIDFLIMFKYISNHKFIVISLTWALIATGSAIFQRQKKLEYIGKWQSEIEEKIKAIQTVKDSRINQQFDSSSSNYNIASYNPSSYNPSFSSTSSYIPGQIQRKVSFYGYIGGSESTMELDINGNMINGSYFNDFDKKKYSLNGTFSDIRSDNAGYSSGLIAINETVDGRVSGKFEFDAEDPKRGGDYNLRIPSKLFDYTSPLEFQTLSGTYTDSNNISYDTYFTTDKNQINNWKEQTIKGKLIIPSDTQQYSSKLFDTTYFIEGADGTNYFTRNKDKFKGISNGSAVEITAKVRHYNQPASYSENQCYGNPNCIQGKSYNTRLGIFQITDVKKG